MARAKKDAEAPKKTRSRFGCWPCKSRKVKCGEEKPVCLNCQRHGETCDYSIKLVWGGRTKRKPDEPTGPSTSHTVPTSPSNIVFPSPQVFSGTSSNPVAVNDLLQRTGDSKRPTSRHSRSQSNITSSAGGWTFLSGGKGAKQGERPQEPEDSEARSASNHIRGGGLLPEFPSEPGSALGSPTLAQKGLGSDSRMLQPMSTAPGSAGGMQNPDDDYFMSPDRSKRQKIGRDAASLGERGADTPMDVEGSSANSVRSPRSLLSPRSPLIARSQTPGSSTASDQVHSGYQMTSSSRRSSVPVSSLLSRHETSPKPSDHSERQYPVRSNTSTLYGYDNGGEDNDAPEKEDGGAITLPPDSPDHTKQKFPIDSISNPSLKPFEPGGYYAKPVAIRIPNSLIPLPDKLRTNSWNLLYFHHFLNHTARILVPHDCDRNPYVTVLPQMAVYDDDLLNLLLAFSASHRARLLGHKRPDNRIALWVQTLFPKLREVLQRSKPISINTIATAIMLASLEIISPSAFGETTLSWQSHLDVARGMWEQYSSAQKVRVINKDWHFLSRWYAYLDVLGSLSGRHASPPLTFEIYCFPNDFDESIDCLLGFTARYLRLLGQIATLVKTCEPDRLDESGAVRQDWSPSPEITSKADDLLFVLEIERKQGGSPCPHPAATASAALAATRIAEGASGTGAAGGVEEARRRAQAEARADAHEISVTNELYHWAGTIQVLRRVLNRPSRDREVQRAVGHILDGLDEIRPGSSAEACLLWPMFTAGCEVGGRGERRRVMQRMGGAEGFGMKQLVNARTLMQKAWEMDVPWENLVTDEFIG